MPASKLSLSAALALLCLTVSVTQCCLAQEWTKDPTTWWPDPSTGLMWAGQVHGNPHPNPKDQFACCILGASNGLNWQQANDYCVSLRLGGFTNWRLPSLDEVKAATGMRKTVTCCSSHFGEVKAIAEADTAFESMPYDALFFKKGGIEIFEQPNGYQLMIIWTTTLYQPKGELWTVVLGSGSPFETAPITHPYAAAECVRPMEPDLLQTAKAAEVDHPVPDIQTLQTFIPLNKARLAYQAGNYQESIAQAQIAISLKADPAVAYWGIGISYGRLGEWDQAIANLQTSLSIDKNGNDVKTALKWAKDGLKAAKKRKQPKELSPTWK